MAGAGGRPNTPSENEADAAHPAPSASVCDRPCATADRGSDARDVRASRGRRRTPRTTDSRHDLPIAPNLLGRSFTAEQPEAVWLADISYIPTDEGFLYLAAIKDMATRQIVGWAMADHLRAELCIDALVMALQRFQPGPGLIHHTDRGAQYASCAYRVVLERHGIQPSMSRRGKCLDNAPMESGLPPGEWRDGIR